MVRPTIVRATMTMVGDEALPDLLQLATDGLAWRRLRGLSVRSEALAAIEELRKIVWRDLLADDAGSQGSRSGPTSEPETDMLVSVKYLATAANVSPSFIYRQVRSGGLHSCAHRDGRNVWLERDGATEWLRGRSR